MGDQKVKDIGGGDLGVGDGRTRRIVLLEDMFYFSVISVLSKSYVFPWL